MTLLAAEKKSSNTRSLTPREIVTELERYIVGQDLAKRAVAIAIWRERI